MLPTAQEFFLLSSRHGDAGLFLLLLLGLMKSLLSFCLASGSVIPMAKDKGYTFKVSLATGVMGSEGKRERLEGCSVESDGAHNTDVGKGPGQGLDD